MPDACSPATKFRRRDSTVAGRRGIAFTTTGDFVRILLSLPLIDANADEPIDLWTTPEARPLQRLLQRQTCIRRVLFSPCRQNGPLRTSKPGCPIPVYGRYRDVIHSSPQKTPDDYFPCWLAEALGLRAPSPDFQIRCERNRNDSRGIVALDIPPDDLEPGHLDEFRKQASSVAMAVSCLRRPISTTLDVERAAELLAGASLFVGRYSWRACLAILAGVPTIVLRRPAEQSMLRIVLPPNQEHLWQVDWNPVNRLPDPASLINSIAKHTNTNSNDGTRHAPGATGLQRG